MSIAGIGSTSSLLVQSLVDLRRQLDDLQRQIGTGQKSTDYAGIGIDRGLGVSLRAQADGLGRLVVTAPTATSVSLAEDVAGSPFGFKLASVNSSLTGATVTGPAGSPAAISVDLGAANPNDGDTITYQFTLPDGSSENL